MTDPILPHGTLITQERKSSFFRSVLLPSHILSVFSKDPQFWIAFFSLNTYSDFWVSPIPPVCLLFKSRTFLLYFRHPLAFLPSSLPIYLDNINELLDVLNLYPSTLLLAFVDSANVYSFSITFMRAALLFINTEYSFCKSLFPTFSLLQELASTTSIRSCFSGPPPIRHSCSSHTSSSNLGLCFYKICFWNPLFSSVLASLSINNFLWLQIFFWRNFPEETPQAANHSPLLLKLLYFTFIIKNKLNLELSKPIDFFFNWLWRYKCD